VTTLMEFALIPLDKGDSFSAYVSETLKIVDASGLDYVLTPMGTIVEGDWDELQALLTRCFRALEASSGRVSLSVKFDHRAGRSGRLAGKVRSVEEKAGRRLRTT
jgi:uncharacterized protein (TIGR00106 family)